MDQAAFRSRSSMPDRRGQHVEHVERHGDAVADRRGRANVDRFGRHLQPIAISRRASSALSCMNDDPHSQTRANRVPPSRSS